MLDGPWWKACPSRSMLDGSFHKVLQKQSKKNSTHKICTLSCNNSPMCTSLCDLLTMLHAYSHSLFGFFVLFSLISLSLFSLLSLSLSSVSFFLFFLLPCSFLSLSFLSVLLSFSVFLLSPLSGRSSLIVTGPRKRSRFWLLTLLHSRSSSIMWVVITHTYIHTSESWSKLLMSTSILW